MRIVCGAIGLDLARAVHKLLSIFIACSPESIVRKAEANPAPRNRTKVHLIHATSAAKRFLNCALACLYLQFSKKQGPDRTRLSQLFQAIAIAFTPALCKANARPQAATSNVLPVGWPPHLLYAIGLKPAQPWWGCILPIHSPLEPSIFRNSLKRCPFQDFPYVKL